MQKPMSFLFRLDANAHIGNGHLVRSMMLARGLRLRGHSTHVLSHPLPSSYAALLHDHVVHEITEHGSDGLNELSVIAGELTIDWLIIDSYTIDASFETQARAFVRHIMVIDDLGNRPHDCDLLLDQNIANSLQANYTNLVPRQCRVLLGLDYLLARDSFYQNKPENRSGTVVFLGGGDRSAALLDLKDRLDKVTIPRPLHLLVTAAYRTVQIQIAGLVSPNDCKLHIDLADTATLCRSVEYAVVQCGFIAYELALLGTPMLIIYTTPIQREVALALASRGHGIAFDEADLDNSKYLRNALDRLKTLKPTPLNTILQSGTARVIKYLESLYD
jgi:UDP-2,4-diacetamido-2,4,6-trideoxy-beta-L-altropyranose hydrolase